MDNRFWRYEGMDNDINFMEREKAHVEGLTTLDGWYHQKLFNMDRAKTLIMLPEFPVRTHIVTSGYAMAGVVIAYKCQGDIILPDAEDIVRLLRKRRSFKISKEWNKADEVRDRLMRWYPRMEIADTKEGHTAFYHCYW